MCGIIGYAGKNQAAPFILDGLARLEYRGYDSAGVAVVGSGGNIEVQKCKGRLQILRDKIEDGKLVGAVTHVFLNDPTKGCGVFIENMIEDMCNMN